MRIAVYCQHVLGIGHFFRTLELCRALAGHRVLLISGGSPVEAVLPAHVRLAPLPGLMMDSEFKALHGAEGEASVEQIKTRRRKMLDDCLEAFAPDILLLELYPFGRKAFRFEIDPVLERMRTRRPRSCRVVCSLRDILVEKKDTTAYESRVVKTLNRWFDALLVHSDPNLFSLEETFGRVRDIAPPMVYTGYVTPRPASGARHRMRRRFGLGDGDTLVVASAGGGKVGLPLLEAAVEAAGRSNWAGRLHLRVFGGPFMADGAYARLAARATERIHVARFTPHFLDHLAAADLSISMAGYNTCMNILAAEVPALVWPFAQNREQHLRAERLSRMGALELIEDGDLQGERLASMMQQMLSRRRRPASVVDLDGARHTAEWMTDCL